MMIITLVVRRLHNDGLIWPIFPPVAHVLPKIWFKIDIVNISFFQGRFLYTVLPRIEKALDVNFRVSPTGGELRNVVMPSVTVGDYFGDYGDGDVMPPIGWQVCYSENYLEFEIFFGDFFFWIFWIFNQLPGKLVICHSSLSCWVGGRSLNQLVGGMHSI